MKKTIVSVLMLFVLLTSVMAWQETYNQSSKEVKIFNLLRRLSGTPTAEPMYPITASQLLSMVNSLDNSKFGNYETELYEDLKSRLETPDVLFNIDDMGIDCDLPLLLTGYYKRVDPVFHSIADRPNLANLVLQFNLTPYFAADFDLNVSCWENSKPTDSIFTAYSTWRKNDLDLSMPVKAYGSVGTEHFNFTAGRDKVSTGNAVTGNLTINDKIVKEDYLKASLVKGPFSYDWTLISFDNAREEEITFKNPRKYVINHRFSVALFNCLTLSADEGAVMYTDNIFGDPMIFNPFMLIHNYFTFMSGDTNNFFSLDANFNSKFGLEVNAQVLFDQIMNSFETESSGANANAFLLNTQYSKAVGNGILSAYAEGVYVSSGCYLKADSQSYNREPVLAYDNELVDMVMDFRTQWSDILEKNYLGYPYGPDTKALGFGASYLYKGQNMKLDFFLMDKGPYGGRANEQRDSAEPISEEYKNNTKMFKVSVGADGTLLKGITYDCAFNWNVTRNFNHTTEDEIGPEFKICISIDPLAYVKRHSL